MASIKIILKNLIEMLKERNIIVPEYESMIKEMSQDVIDNNILEDKNFLNKTIGDIRIVWSYDPGMTIKAEEVRKMAKNSAKKGARKMIYISLFDKKIPQRRINDISEEKNMDIEVFTYVDFLVSHKSHLYLPNDVKILTTEEYKNECPDMGNTGMCEINMDDPLVRYSGAKIGNILRTKSLYPFDGYINSNFYCYRKVINYSSNLVDIPTGNFYLNS